MTAVRRARDAAVAGHGVEHLRILIANERRDRLELLAQVVARLVHDAAR